MAEVTTDALNKAITKTQRNVSGLRGQINELSEFIDRQLQSRLDNALVDVAKRKDTIKIVVGSLIAWDVLQWAVKAWIF